MSLTTTELVDSTRVRWSTLPGSRPITTHVWVPESAAPSPVVVLSHGTGGAAEDLTWLAEPLCAAGFLVASVDHHGNSYNDEYLVEGFTFVWERPRDISRLLDHVIATYDVDEQRIGAAGFSLGGYTVAALLGARINPAVLEAMFAGLVPAPIVPEFPALLETLRAAYPPAALTGIISDGGGSVRDDRIRAGFLMAPAVGELLDPSSLQLITAPVELRWGDADDVAPAEENALIYLHNVPNATGSTLGANVGHYEFLGDREDPEGVRARTVADALRFFDRELRRQN
jgi:predicted dienelactone hydrolase